MGLIKEYGDFSQTTECFLGFGGSLGVSVSGALESLLQLGYGKGRNYHIVPESCL